MSYVTFLPPSAKMVFISACLRSLFPEFSRDPGKGRIPRCLESGTLKGPPGFEAIKSQLVLRSPINLLTNGEERT